MKINEVESLVQITKKNIRFYEDQGLLSPKRNSENGYRDYSEKDVEILQQIKLFRKLGVSIEEIRHLLTGIHTVSDCMKRHMISLEREKNNLDQSIAFCERLQISDVTLSSLNAEKLLEQMEEIEKSGTTFQNKQTSDVRIRYIAPAIITLIFVGLMFGIIMLLIWAYAISPEDTPPIWFLWLCIAICFAVSAGIILALIQRIREIGKGEIDDAKRY